jgi:hypothetical protein
MASETLPESAFESLLPKLLAILQVTQRPEGTSNVRNKQDLLQAVSRARIAPSVKHTRTRTQIQAFREALNHARSLASALPGGELHIEEQDEVIAMLVRLREKKRCVVPLPPRAYPSIYILFFADYSCATFRTR